MNCVLLRAPLLQRRKCPWAIWVNNSSDKLSLVRVCFELLSYSEEIIFLSNLCLSIPPMPAPNCGDYFVKTRFACRNILLFLHPCIDVYYALFTSNSASRCLGSIKTRELIVIVCVYFFSLTAHSAALRFLSAHI